MPHHTFTGLNGRPGISQVVETFENEFLWGHYESQQFTGLLISQDARDMGNTDRTEILRQGLLLGLVESTQMLKEWDPTATDGSECVWGILNQTVSLRSLVGTQDRLNGYVVYSGGLLADRVIIPGNTQLGIKGDPLEFQVRAALRANFKLNDSYYKSRPNGFFQNLTAAELAAGVIQVGLEQSHRTFSAVNNGTMLLPATPVSGVEYEFYAEGATLTITSGTPNIRVPGEALAAAYAVTDAVVTICGTGTEWLVKE